MSDTPATVASAQPVRPADVRGPLVGELTDSIAPMPTRTTLWMRTFVPYQAYRLAMVSLRMLKMIRRSHAH